MPNDSAEGEQEPPPNDAPQPPPVSGEFFQDWLDVTEPNDIDLPPEQAPPQRLLLKYNRGQWLDSFEDQLSLRRPPLTKRVLSAMSIQAWLEYGTKDMDPVEAAKSWSAELDKKKEAPGGVLMFAPAFADQQH